MQIPFKVTFWKVLLAFIWTAGAYAVFIRLTQGLGAATNLSDKFPWGLWIGFDVVCGVGLAAGGFTIAAAVYVLHLKQFYPVLRPAILTAFLGYAIVIVGLLLDIGHPLRIYHPMIMGNFTSVMFEVAMCVMFYTTVLALEFSTVIFERFGWKKPKKWVGKIIVPLVIAGVVLSFLHQSSLGSLYLIMPSKLYPLWYSPLLPVFFILSAISTGFAMVILESHLSFNAFGHRLEKSILQHLGRAMLVGLVLYLVLRVQDLTTRGVWDLTILNRTETYTFWCEIAFGLLIPIIMLSIKKIRLSTKGLYLSSIFAISGFLFNRLNVSITGIEGAAGEMYIPSWMEVAVSLSLVGVAVFLFALAVRYFPVFGKPLIDTKKNDRAGQGKLSPMKKDNFKTKISHS